MVGLLQVKDDTILPGLHGKTGLFIIFRRINGLLRYMIAVFIAKCGLSVARIRYGKVIHCIFN
jgi:hypothetical protein